MGHDFWHQNPSTDSQKMDVWFVFTLGMGETHMEMQKDTKCEFCIIYPI